MHKKILLGVRIVLPFIIIVLLFFWIYDSNKGTEFALTNSLFYVGVISIIYGVAALFAPNSSLKYMQNTIGAGVSLVSAEQKVKDFHDGKDWDKPKIPLTSVLLKLEYIILGVLFFIAAMIVYYV